MRLLGRPVASARDETAPSRDDATVSSTVPRGFDDAADDAAPPTTRKKQTKTQRLVASMMHSNVATEADALAERLRTGAATTTTTPYSYAGRIRASGSASKARRRARVSRASRDEESY